MRFIPSFISLLVAVVFVFYKHGWQKQDKFLLIGILSAPEHFELRDAIRQSWVQDIGNDVTYYFLIGEQLCLIPIEDRIDEFSCEESRIYLSTGETEKPSQSGFLTCYANFDVPLYIGHTFTVQYDIIIQQLGVLRDLFEESVRVSLVEAATGSIITSTSFFTDESANASSVLWKPVEQYRLPKGFEGKIIIESNAHFKNLYRNCGFNWKSSSNILSYHFLWSSKDKHVRFNNYSLSVVAFGFQFPDVGELRVFLNQKLQRKKIWAEKMSFVYQRLHEEKQSKNDILSLNVLDVYRSLPKKMLLFFEWVNKNAKFSYVLKADDDTFINIPLVIKELQSQFSVDKYSYKGVWWWSDFREGWPVQLFGKWRETSYHSITYPTFPCGAGYVLSHGAVEFLSRIADKLYTDYQGEDAALGIWLAGTNPQSTLNRTVCSWTCNTLFIETSCNHAQLTAEQMLKVYNQIQQKSDREWKEET